MKKKVMKQKHLFQKIMTWVERLLSYPGCDQKTLNTRKTIWVSTVFGLFHVVLLTTAFLILAPDSLRILIHYGFILITVLVLTLIISPHLKAHFAKYFVAHLTVMLSATFYFILKLGGIATSAGLIFACLAFVLLSVTLQNTRITVFLFIIFTSIVIISGIAGTRIISSEKISPRLNAIVFMINTLSMSALSLYIVLEFFAQQRKIDTMESEKMKELTEAKNKLFTNITHEFRTPLTVIQGMADLIEKNPDEWLSEGTSKIRNNSNILLKLVNQMLDLAKIETGMIQLHLVQSDIYAYIGYISELFRSLADSRSISLQYQTSGEPLIMDFDPDKLLHILSNLLSNALKFTPEGGLIAVSAYPNDTKQLLSIEVTDSGVGIIPEHLPHLFDRFYQIENGPNNPNGTGLGLALAKEMTEMLGGSISVKSQPNIGTSFIVELPVSHDAPSENLSGIGINKEQVNSLLSFSNKTKPLFEPIIPSNKTVPLLLIVEDSHDVSQYLTAILKSEYRIEHAENGKIGLEKALDRIPDIILSDVMMPEMDGISLLEKVKNDMRTSHIPVVLLTAKADVASRLSGLEHGADAYLAKPFDEKELHIVLKNLIDIRKKLHKRYASPENFPPSPENGYKIEDAFMGKVKQVLEDNLDDDEFGIAQLCRELAVSHTQLYRKFKSVSNQSIAEYFKLLRLYKSKTLLSTTKMNVTEVAFASGFKNLSYFSREFTHQFGKSPKEFRI